MRVGVLGPLLAEGADGETTPRGQRPRDVLAVLLQRRGHIVTPDALLDLVWGDAARDLTSSAVHTVVARLRRSLGSDSIETHDAGYRLGRAVQLDSDDFDAALRRAREATAAGDATGAVAAYRDAVAVWRGPHAFEGVSDDLVMADRARLEEARAQTIDELAAALLSTGTAPATDEALALATALTRDHPLREGSHRTAMLAAVRAGRQAEALEIYRGLRARLRQELGIEPGPPTQALHLRILEQDPTLEIVPRAGVAVGQGLDSAGEKPRPGQRESGRLPAPLTPTVGRDQEVTTVLTLLEQGRRLVTILGPGGVGKSRLLAEVGTRLSADPDQEVVYVDLAGLGVSAAADIADAVSVSFRLPVSREDPVTGLVTALADDRLVALVDEAEWSTPAVAEVASRVLAGCPGVRLVVTSRVPLEVLGESRVLLAPLACPAEDASGGDARIAPAVRLLEDRLRDHAPDIVIGDADGAHLGRLARRVDGLPLALELLAGYAASRSLAELVPLVEAPLDVASPQVGHRPRHRSLRDTLLWSVERLSPSERTVLRRLGVFAGSFDVSAARAVVGGSLHPLKVEAGLRALVREALVQLDRRGPRTRVRLLRTVRDLALEELTAAGEIEQVRRRHREWYAARWRGQPLHDELVIEVGESYDDYLEALRQALAARDARSVADLAIALGRRWAFVEAAGIGVRWLDRVLAADLLDPVQTARVQVLWVGLGHHMSWTDTSHVVGTTHAALADDPDWLAQSWLLEAIHRYMSGDFSGAVAASERMVQTAKSGARWHLPEALATLAAALAAAGERERALAAADQAWALIGASPTVVHFAAVVPKVGLSLVDADQPQRAYDIFTTAIADVGARFGIAPTLTTVTNVGWAALGIDRPAEALHWFGHAAETGSHRGLFLAEDSLGTACALAFLGHPDAEVMLDAADELCRRHALTLSPRQAAHRDRARALAPSSSAAHLDVQTDDDLASPIFAAARALAT